VGEVRKRNESGSITGEVLDRVKTLVRFDLNFFCQPWDEEGARGFVIRPRAVSMVALIWRDASATRTWLKHRATSDSDWSVRRSAIQELARGWKEDPDTLPMLKELANLNRVCFFRELTPWLYHCASDTVETSPAQRQDCVSASGQESVRVTPQERATLPAFLLVPRTLTT
jgi:hypothetical protein